MKTKATLGIARELFDAEGNFDFPGPGLKLIDEIPDIDYRIFSEKRPEIAAEQVRGCDMVISAATRWTEHSLEGNDQLVAVLFTGVGYDHIDVEALTKTNAILCFAPDAVRRPMACTIIALTLAVAMRLVSKDRITRQGRWADQRQYRGEGLTGKTFGSIGVGNIGREMFTLAKPFGMRHLGYDPHLSPEDLADLGVELVDMDTLLAESDFVSISVPLRAETHHLVGEREFAKMKQSAYLISTSRGPIVDEKALIHALESEQIRGAALDVFEQEPVDPDNPLLKIDNVVVTPHSLCHTDEYYKTAWSGKIRQAHQIARGEIPDNVVNKEVLEKPEFLAKLARFKNP